MGKHRVWWAAACAALTVMASTGPASAQGLLSDLLPKPVETQYCYQGQCYPLLSMAEQALEAANTPYTPWVQKDVALGTPTENGVPAWMTYEAVDTPPAQINPSVYSFSSFAGDGEFCQRSGDPVFPTLCRSEQEAVDGLVASYQRAHGGRVEHEISGDYFAPFSYISPQGGALGFMSHQNERNMATQRRIRIRIYNDAGVQTWGFEHYLFKMTSFACRAGYVAKPGRHPSYDPTTTSPLTAPLCDAPVVDQVITTDNTLQCNSGAANDHPCYPATGDKARFEVDAEFGGVAFTRSYHSVRQATMRPAFAPGWVHTWSDRIVGARGDSRLTLVDDRGFLEVFQRDGWSWTYISRTRPGRRIDASTADFVLREASATRIYGANGRLREVRPDGPLATLTLAYDGERLSTVTDATGRVLRLTYNGNRLSGVVLPDGATVAYRYDAAGNLVGATGPDGGERVYHYNEPTLNAGGDRHALTGITAPSGKRYASFGYDSRGRVVLSQLHDGTRAVEKTTLRYLNDGRVEVVTPTGEVKTYYVGTTGGVRAIGMVAGGSGNRSTGYAMALPNWRRATDGVVTRFAYLDGRLRERIDADGTPKARRTVMTRDVDGRLTRIDVQPLQGGAFTTARSTTNGYNSRGQRTSMTITGADGASATTTWTYCEAADVTAGTCPLVGLLIAEDGPRTDVSDITRYAYRMADAPECATQPATCPWRKGDLWTVTDAAGNVQQVARRDGAGRPLELVDANGVVTALTYDAAGRRTRVAVLGQDNNQTADDRVTRTAYDADGRVTEVIAPDGARTTFRYDDAGRQVEVIDAGGNRTTRQLDPAGEVLREDALDAGGDLWRTQSSSYDVLGRLASTTAADGGVTQFQYDAEGRVVATTDPIGRRTTTSYDVLGQAQASVGDATGIAATTGFAYDGLGQLTAVTDPNGLVTRYAYDGLGRMTQLTSPDTGVTANTYDAAGNARQNTDARGVTRVTRYDALNRPLEVTNSLNGNRVVYTWDALAPGVCPSGGGTRPKGRLTSIVGPESTTTYCYNAFGDVTRRVDAMGGRTFVTEWRYRSNGQLEAMVYPDGTVVDYVYSTSGLVTGLGVTRPGAPREVLLQGVQYAPSGPPVAWTFGNGLPMRRTLTLDYRPGTVEDGDPEGANIGLGIGYEFDQAGQLVALRNGKQQDPPLRLYGHDGLGRLAVVDDGTGIPLREYVYDNTGNRTASATNVPRTWDPAPGGGDPGPEPPPGDPVASSTDAWPNTGLLEQAQTTDDGGTGSSLVWSTYTYAPGTHRMVTAAGDALTYDAMGNLVARGNDSLPGGVREEYRYDENARLATAIRHGSTIASYGHNPMGQRIRRTVNGDSVWSLYDLEGNWLGEYDSAGMPRQQVIWFAGMPVGVIDRRREGAAQEGARLFYVQTDALGTPRAVIDPISAHHPWGKAVWRWELEGDAFGGDLPIDDPDNDGKRFTFDMRFPGQRYDDATGLHYNYFRDYDPAVGRYVQSDPIGLAGGISTFGYANGVPNGRVDVYGLASSTAGTLGPSVPQSGVGRGLAGRVVRVLGVANPAARVVNAWEIGSAGGGMLNNWIEDNVGSPGTAFFDLINDDVYTGNPEDECPPDSNPDDEGKRRRNCQALKDSILRTCASLTGRKKFACFAAAEESYRQCMGW